MAHRPKSGSSGSSASGRGVRVADQLQRELAELIQREVKDPRIGLVTLTGVDLTPDYAVATVWFTVLPSDPETVERTLAGLRRAAVFLRGRVGRALRIHTSPELRFTLDHSVERGLAMSKLIDAANAATSVAGDDASEGTVPPAPGADDGEPAAPDDNGR